MVSSSLTATAVATVESNEVMGDWMIWSWEDITILLLEYRNEEAVERSCSLMREEKQWSQCKICGSRGLGTMLWYHVKMAELKESLRREMKNAERAE